MSVDQVKDELRVRVLFAAEPEAEREVRRRIDLALSGQWSMPDGFTTALQLRRSWPEDVSPAESQLVERLMSG